MSLLSLENITKEYGNRTVLNGASLRIEKGERVALVGPNGSGKTTLLRIAAGMEACDGGSVVIARGSKMGYLTQNLREMDPEGRIFRETALYHEEVSRLEHKIRLLEKELSDPAVIGDPDTYRKTISEYSRLTNRFEHMDGYTIESKIKSVLLGLGLKEEALTLPLDLLSGGEKMRVAFARIMLEEPDLLILDEPTNHLDIDATEWLEGYLKRYDGGVLVVSHDRYFLDQVATRVAELGNGTIIERSGDYSTFMEQKKRMREFALKEESRLRQEIRREKDIADRLKSARKISAWKSRMKVIDRLEKELTVDLADVKKQHHLFRTAAPKVSFSQARHVSAEIAMAEGLAKNFGGAPLFSNVNFLVTGGEKLGIIGPNGCGKTTLINILLGRDSDYSGRVRLGEWVNYGYLGQEVDFEDESRSIIQELLAKKEMTVDDARNYLAGFQFYGDEVDKKIEVLSGGERVRLYLACLMLDDPVCLIMDEPTNHLDVPARDALESALLGFKGTLIAVSHDRYFLTRCVNRILEFSDGTVHSYQGNYEAYRQIKRAAAEEAAEKKEQLSAKKRTPGKSAGTKAQGEQRSAKEKAPSAEELELKISELEKTRFDMENSFGQDTPPEAYIEYDALIRELDQLYDAYSKVI